MLTAIPSTRCLGHYSSPLGPLRLLWQTRPGEHTVVEGLYFEDHHPIPREVRERLQSSAPTHLPRPVADWLESYFESPIPAESMDLKLSGTDFQRRVWAQLTKIPLGQTRTYGDLARILGGIHLARAVGAAVARNPVSILVPCHRVRGSDGSLTGFAGGMERKRFLLRHEGVFA
ncbi:MAG: methylated-DNA--[protein]-cysteine S-methyltransferase [Planctomycetota bacterium]